MMQSVIKSLRSAPALTITLILVFGLGIGANCALFAVINSLLFRPLPYFNPESLVAIQPRTRTFDLTALAQARTLSGVAAMIALRFPTAFKGAAGNVFGF